MDKNKFLKILGFLVCIIVGIGLIVFTVNNKQDEIEAYDRITSATFPMRAMYKVGDLVDTVDIQFPNQTKKFIDRLELNNKTTIWLNVENVVIWSDTLPDNYLLESNWKEIDPNEETMTATINMPDGSVVAGTVTALSHPFGPPYESWSVTARNSVTSKNCWDLVIDGKLYLAPASRVTLTSKLR